MIWSNSLFFIQDSIFSLLLHQFEGNSPHSFRTLRLCLEGIREMDDYYLHGLSPGPFLPGRLLSLRAAILLLLLREKGWKRGTITLPHIVFFWMEFNQYIDQSNPSPVVFTSAWAIPLHCSGWHPLELDAFFVFRSSVSLRSDIRRPVHSITISKNKKLRGTL